MNALHVIVIGAALSLGLARAAEPDLAAEAAVASPPLSTEPSPYTIGKGRVAFEFTLADVAIDRRNVDGANTTSVWWQWPIMMRYGITENFDIHIGAEALITESFHDRDADTNTRRTGFGDVLLRAKWNLIGNDTVDDRAFAIALRPELRLPTARSGLGNRGVEGGLTVPMNFFLPWDLEMGWAPGIHAVRNSDDDGYEVGFASLVSLYIPFTDEIWGLLEFDSSITTERGDKWQGAINVGMDWYLDDDLVIEAGLLIGVTTSADDLNPYLMLVKRF